MPSDPQDIGAKLDEILVHLRRLDKRDRMRTWGAAIHTAFQIIPLLLFLWGGWYLYHHADEVLKRITSEAAKQAAAMTQEKSESFMEGLKKYFPQ